VDGLQDDPPQPEEDTVILNCLKIQYRKLPILRTVFELQRIFSLI
jgi:hypothetical protein